MKANQNQNRFQQKQPVAEYEVYKRIKLLGEGAFGKAYLCECISDKTFCVIKQMDLKNMTEQEKRDTTKEAKILEALKHPNIIRFREVYKTKKGKLCIVMDYADGGDLTSRIKEQKNQLFKENQILDWFTQMCLAIKHVHDRKIIHRDIKTQNIFLTKENTVKLGDFGIAKVLTSTREKAKTIIGTPYYLSPEIIENKPYSFKSDVWSLGVVLYELCALKPPFNADSIHVLALKIVRGQYDPIPAVYSKELRDLVMRLMNVNTNNRPSVQEILKMPVITNRIKNFLTESMRKNEFAHTVLHRQNFVDLRGKFSDIMMVNQENPPPLNIQKQMIQEEIAKKSQQQEQKQSIQQEKPKTPQIQPIQNVNQNQNYHYANNNALAVAANNNADKKRPQSQQQPSKPIPMQKQSSHQEAILPRAHPFQSQQQQQIQREKEQQIKKQQQERAVQYIKKHEKDEEKKKQLLGNIDNDAFGNIKQAKGILQRNASEQPQSNAQNEQQQQQYNVIAVNKPGIREKAPQFQGNLEDFFPNKQKQTVQQPAAKKSISQGQEQHENVQQQQQQINAQQIIAVTPKVTKKPAIVQPKQKSQQNSIQVADKNFNLNAKKAQQHPKVLQTPQQMEQKEKMLRDQKEEQRKLKEAEREENRIQMKQDIAKKLQDKQHSPDKQFIKWVGPMQPSSNNGEEEEQIQTRAVQSLPNFDTDQQKQQVPIKWKDLKNLQDIQSAGVKSDHDQIDQELMKIENINKDIQKQVEAEMQQQKVIVEECKNELSNPIGNQKQTSNQTQNSEDSKENALLMELESVMQQINDVEGVIEAMPPMQNKKQNYFDSCSQDISKINEKSLDIEGDSSSDREDYDESTQDEQMTIQEKQQIQQQKSHSKEVEENMRVDNDQNSVYYISNYEKLEPDIDTQLDSIDKKEGIEKYMQMFPFIAKEDLKQYLSLLFTLVLLEDKAEQGKDLISMQKQKVKDT